MAKTKAQLLDQIKCLNHNYSVKVDECKRGFKVNEYLWDLLNKHGVETKDINEYIMERDKQLKNDISCPCDFRSDCTLEDGECIAFAERYYAPTNDKDEYELALDIIRNYPGIDDSSIMQRYVDKLQEVVNKYKELINGINSLNKFCGDNSTLCTNCNYEKM